MMLLMMIELKMNSNHTHTADYKRSRFIGVYGTLVPLDSNFVAIVRAEH
jgi:hypothetical protein